MILRFEKTRNHTRNKGYSTNVNRILGKERLNRGSLNLHSVDGEVDEQRERHLKEAGKLEEELLEDDNVLFSILLACFSLRF